MTEWGGEKVEETKSPVSVEGLQLAQGSLYQCLKFWRVQATSPVAGPVVSGGA